jgi:hypothetical protein
MAKISRSTREELLRVTRERYAGSSTQEKAREPGPALSDLRQACKAQSRNHGP